MTHIGMAAAQAGYLFLPLIGGSVCAAIVIRMNLWRVLKRPIDGGLTFRGRRLLGDNKTWRGLAYQIVGCTAAVAVQKYAIGTWAADYSVIDYERASVIALGAAFAIGATVSELPNSFLKRQLGIGPGQRPPDALVPIFYVLDQVDVVVGIWALLLWWVRPDVSLVVASFAVVFVLHQMLSAAGYWLGVRRSASW